MGVIQDLVPCQLELQAINEAVQAAEQVICAGG